MSNAVKRYLVREVMDADPADGQGFAGVIELVDLSGGLKKYTVGGSVADLTALAAVPKGDMRPDRQVRFVEDVSAQYAYDEQASSGDVQPTDSDGTGTGFGNGWWSKYSGIIGVENLVQTTVLETVTIATIAIPDNTSVLVTVDIVGFSTNGADQVAYKKAALVYRRSAGAAALQGAVQDVMADVESDALFDVTIGVSGNNAIITVTGVAAKTMNWKARHTVAAVS